MGIGPLLLVLLVFMIVGVVCIGVVGVVGVGVRVATYSPHKQRGSWQSYEVPIVIPSLGW
jgi:hypothetical protein